MGLSAASKRSLLKKTHPAYAKEAQKGAPHGKMAEHKMGKVMKEFKEGTLHSGSAKGPKVKNRKQAIAIALSEARTVRKK